jgi:hypothetical protein
VGDRGDGGERRPGRQAQPSSDQRGEPAALGLELGAGPGQERAVLPEVDGGAGRQRPARRCSASALPSRLASRRVNTERRTSPPVPISHPGRWHPLPSRGTPCGRSRLRGVPGAEERPCTGESRRLPVPPQVRVATRISGPEGSEPAAIDGNPIRPIDRATDRDSIFFFVVEPTGSEAGSTSEGRPADPAVALLLAGRRRSRDHRLESRPRARAGVSPSAGAISVNCTRSTAPAASRPRRSRRPWTSSRPDRGSNGRGPKPSGSPRPGTARLRSRQPPGRRNPVRPGQPIGLRPGLDRATTL